MRTLFLGENKNLDFFSKESGKIPKRAYIGHKPQNGDMHTLFLEN
jgi:hypothetical protein